MSRVTDGNRSISRNLFADWRAARTRSTCGLPRSRHRARRVDHSRVAASCPAKSDHLIARKNLRRQREIAMFAAPEGQRGMPSDSSAPFRSKKSRRRFVCARQFGAPAVFPRAMSPRRRSLFPARRKKNAAELKHGHSLRARAHISSRAHRAGRNEAWPQCDVIFAQRIAQLDRVFTESELGRAEIISKCALHQSRAPPKSLANPVSRSCALSAGLVGVNRLRSVPEILSTP